MGIDGSDIKRLRLEREKRTAALNEPPPLPDPDTDQQVNPEKTTIEKLRPLVFIVVVPVLLVMMISRFNHDKEITYSSPSTVSTERSANRTTTEDYAGNTSTPNFSDFAASYLSSMEGNVCSASVSGFFTKTFKVDWTARTTKIQALMVLGQIGKIKERLYQDDVRYFQFPNDSGTYNVIDWKTGKKKSISDHAPYYF